ncbi:MAG: restriction endonuclease subunit S [Parvibaculum sp.]
MITLQERVHSSPPPSNWILNKLHRVFRVRTAYKNLGMREDNLLSLSYGRIINKDIDTADGLLPESFETYQIVDPGNIVMRLTDLQNDKRSLRQGLVKERGIITSAYDALELERGHDPRFWAYALLALDLAKYYYSLGAGVRQSIKFADFPNDWIATPDEDTQKAIADFLDRETARIDQLIEKKQLLSVLSAERFRALVSKVVGGGLGLSAKEREKQSDGWRFLALRREITLQRGVDITKAKQNENGRYPVVSSGGVSSFHEEYLCKGPGVIVGRKGSAGKLHFEPRDYWPHDTVLYVKRFGRNHPKFVYYKFMALDLGSFDRSSANPTLNRNLVHPEKVWWPVPQIQERIVADLDSEQARVDALILTNSTSIERLQEFRVALITAAVTGQIDVATWGKTGRTDRRLEQIEEEMSLREARA